MAAAVPIRLRLVCGREIEAGKRCGASLLRLHVVGTAIVEHLSCPRCQAVNRFTWNAEGVTAEALDPRSHAAGAG